MTLNQWRICIVLVAAALFIPGLGWVHLFDWDEINFAESAREMLETGNFLQVQINYAPFWEKPPLFMWIQAFCMSIFGINEFAARLPNAITGIITLLVLFEIGNRFKDYTFGLLWVLVYIGSFLPHFYFKSGIIDPLFNLFIFTSIYVAHVSLRNKLDTLKQILLNMFAAGCLIGLAILTKGPVALLIAMLTLGIFIILNSKVRNLLSVGLLSIYAITALLVASLWFGAETWAHGTWFINEFIQYNIKLLQTGDSGHGQPWFYHPVVLLIGCFPASIFFIVALHPRYYKAINESEKSLIQLLIILFFVVLILFSIVKTKIIHYSSLCYMPLTGIASWYIYDIWIRQKGIPNTLSIFVVILGIVIALLLSTLALIPLYKEYIIPYINDPFAVDNICYPVLWQGWEWIGGVVYIFILVAGFQLRKRIKAYALMLFLGSGIILQFLLYILAPKLEQHIQGSAIQYYKMLQNKDVYVHAVGYKSYAQYFYTKRTKAYFNQGVKARNERWLLDSAVNRPVYIVTKSDGEYFKGDPRFILLKNEGGYKLFKRLN